MNAQRESTGDLAPESLQAVTGNRTRRRLWTKPAAFAGVLSLLGALALCGVQLYGIVTQRDDDETAPAPVEVTVNPPPQDIDVPVTIVLPSPPQPVDPVVPAGSSNPGGQEDGARSHDTSARDPGRPDRQPHPDPKPQLEPVNADQEPNDQMTSASVISLDGSLTGRVGWGDDRVDLFALHAPADGTLTFTVEATCKTVKGQRNGLDRPRVLRSDGSERYHTHDSRVPCGKSVTSAPVTVGANETALIELKPNTTFGTSYSLSWSFAQVR